MNGTTTINEIFNVILNPQFSGWILFWKYLFVAFGILFTLFYIWGIFKTSFLKRAILIDLKEILTYKPFYVKKFATQWKKIERRIKSKNESDFKLAVLEADEILKEAIKEVGYSDGNLTQILEQITEEIISNLNDLKSVRKVKEDIVADPSYKLTEEEAKRILKVYEISLRDLQAI